MKLLAVLVPTVLFAQPCTLGPDSQAKSGIPKGRVMKRTWSTSKGRRFSVAAREISFTRHCELFASTRKCVIFWFC
jgi:hypothetical protein